ncbi:MAG TPA: 3-hydroxyacyl-ACP dehydratase FabZ [Casimicrobiaceae bacterium]|nr:3-hydroxyacyl-ACP dehydratase FabZ [Casimicrobiaceae bacterium]
MIDLDSLDIDKIVAKMPHRYPGVLVDRLVECVPGERIKAIKNVTINEPYFQGHFPSYPVMPGVLMLEALTQLCGVLAVASGLVDADGAPSVSFDTIDGCRFKRQVIPGDQVTLESSWHRVDASHGRFDVRALVDGQVAAEASLFVGVA